MLMAWLPPHVRSSTAGLPAAWRRSSPALSWNLLLLHPHWCFFSKAFFMLGKGQGLLRRVSLNFICIYKIFFRGNWNEKICCQNQDEMFWAYYLHSAFLSSLLLFFTRFLSYNCFSVVTPTGFFGNLVWRFSKYLHNSWASSSTEHVLNSFAQLEDGEGENLHPAGWWAYVSSSA